MSDIIKINVGNMDYNVKDAISREKVQITTSLGPSATENTELLINLDETFCIDVPEVKDNTINADDTWSSRKIYNEFQNLYDYINVNPIIFETYTFGLCADFENNTFTRLADSVVNTGQIVDFDTIPIYGNRRRCNVADDGTINAFYGDAGYTEDGSNGQVMVIQPKFYYRVEPLKVVEQTGNGIGYHLYKANYYISNVPQAGFKLHPAFYDDNGNELEYYLIGAFEGYSDSNNGNKWSSIAGVEPTCSITRATIESRAQNRGSIWHCCDIKIWSAEQLLMAIEFGQFNMQNIIGGGILDSSKTNTGQTAGNGTIKTTETNYTDAISYRGVENPWGNVSKWFGGCNIVGNGSQNGGIPYISNTRHQTEDTITGYSSAGFTVVNDNGYIKYFGYSEDCDWLFMASQTGGSSALPIGDYHYITSDLNGFFVIQLIGYWNSGSLSVPKYSGAFYWGDYLSSAAGSMVGGRLATTPLTTDQSYQANLLLI